MSERDELVRRLRAVENDWATTACYNGTRIEAASLLERDGAEIARLLRWQEDAVALCAKRQCGKRDQRIAELEADIAQVTERLHRREADLLAQMNTNIEVGNLLDAARAALAEAQRDAGRYRWLVNAGSENSPIARAQAVYHLWNGEDGADGFTRALDAAIAKEQSHASE